MTEMSCLFVSAFALLLIGELNDQNAMFADQVDQGCQCASEFFEPCFINGDALDHFGLDAKTKLFQFVGELVALNQVNRRCHVSGCFLDGIA